MTSHRTLAAALLLCTLAAACGELPTRGDTPAHPADASYDSGYTMGSGNNSVQTTGGSVDVELSSATTTSTDTTTREGYTIGSGN